MKIILTFLITVLFLSVTANNGVCSSVSAQHTSYNPIRFKTKSNKAVEKNKFHFRIFSKKKLELKNQTKKRSAVSDKVERKKTLYQDGCSETITEMACSFIADGFSSGNPFIIALTIALLIMIVMFFIAAI
ncbi:MAG: hypothetical protein IAF38_10845 [Bacteroidia bacterium]|nr:hypothetical protein [Bacteroidia bacterium]